MSYDWAQQEALVKQGAMAYGLQQAEYIPPTKRQQLEKQKDLLEMQLAKVNAAIDALDTHPELEKFLDVIQQAG